MSNIASQNKQIAKNTIVLYIRMIVVLILQFYISRRLLASIGVEDYGIYNLVAGFVSMFTFFTSSLSNGYQRFFNFALGRNDYEQYSKILSNSLFIQLVVIIVLAVILETAGLWTLNYKLNIPAGREFAANMVFQGVIIMMAANVLRAPFQAIVVSHQQMNFFALISVLEVVANLGVVLLLNILSTDALLLYAFLHPAVVVVVTMAYMIYAIRKYSYVKIKFKSDKKNIGELASFSGWNLFGSFAHMLQSQGIDIVINLFYGVTINAARGIANQIQNGLNNLSSNFLMASRPQIIQSYAAGDKHRTISLSNNVARLSFMLIWLFALPIMFNIDLVLKIWLGDTIPEKAAIFSNLSIISGLVSVFSTPISTIVHATGKMKRFQVVTSVVILLTVPVAYISQLLGSPSEGVLIAVIAVQLLAQIVRLIIIKDLIDFSIIDYIKSTIVPSALVVIVSLAISFAVGKFIVEPDSFLYCLTVGIINIPCIYYLGTRTNERAIAVNFVKSKIKTSK